MASGGNSHRWFLETGEDRCIYLIREAKRIGKVAAVRLIRETTDHPALIGIQLFNESKQRGLRFDRFNPDANEFSKILTCSGCAQLVDIFTKSIYPHINAQTGVYNPSNENSDPFSSSTHARKRPPCTHQPKGRKKRRQSEMSTNDEDLEESLKSRYQGQFSLPISCMRAPSTSRAVREVDSLFIEHLKKEMVANPTTDVAPLIGLLILNDGEVFDRLHPEAYTYETLGGNNSRTALSELCSERADLAEDQRYTRRMVSIYVNLTDEEAQYLAIKHNRQQSFIHQMITQDKVHLCRLKLMNGSGMTERNEEMPETTTKWRDECSKTLMTTKTQLINNMIFFLAALPPASYALLQKVYSKYEEAKKTGTRRAKPDCRGSNFRELRNLEESTVFSMLQQVANDDMMLNQLNHECKRVKSMLKLKEAFKNEVGELTWEEAAQKYPDFASESRLVRFSGKLEGPTLLAFQQYCRSAISSTSSSRSQQNTSTQILSKKIEGQMFQCHQIKETPESLTYGTVCEALHGVSGLSLVICRFTGQPTTEVEQLLRTAHALNRGAGLEGYVVFAQSSPQEIQKHTEALKQHNFSVEILYWKDVDSNNESDGTIFKCVVVPFVVGVMKEDVVKVRVAMGTDRYENIIEGTQGDLCRRLVSTLTLPNDWILDMGPSNGIESTIHSVLEEKRNILVVGESPIILMEREEEERSSQTESDLHDIESLDDNN